MLDTVRKEVFMGSGRDKSNEEAKQKIEELRREMENLVLVAGTFTSSEVLQISRKLDVAITEYLKFYNRVQVNKKGMAHN